MLRPVLLLLNLVPVMPIIGASMFASPTVNHDVLSPPRVQPASFTSPLLKGEPGESMAAQLAGMGIQILRGADAKYDPKRSHELLTESTRYARFTFSRTIPVDFRSDRLEAIHITELWIPLVQWHKFVVKASDGKMYAYGRGPNSGFNALDSKTRTNVPPVDGWEQFYRQFGKLLDSHVKIAEVECPVLEGVIRKSDWKKLALAALPYARECNIERLPPTVPHFRKRKDHVRIRFSEPYRVELGFRGLVGQSISELIIPIASLKYRSDIMIELNGNLRVFKQESSFRSGQRYGQTPQFRQSLTPFHRLIEEFADRSVSEAQLPEYSLKSIMAKGTRKEFDYTKSIEIADGLLRLLQTSKKVAPRTRRS